MIWNMIIGAVIVAILYVRLMGTILINAMGANKIQMIIYHHQNSKQQICTAV